MYVIYVDIIINKKIIELNEMKSYTIKINANISFIKLGQTYLVIGLVDVT